MLAFIGLMLSVRSHRPLPPYSPDFNKIEHDFAALKRVLAYSPPGTTLDEVVANYRSA